MALLQTDMNSGFKFCPRIGRKSAAEIKTILIDSSHKHVVEKFNNELSAKKQSKCYNHINTIQKMGHLMSGTEKEGGWGVHHADSCDA